MYEGTPETNRGLWKCAYLTFEAYTTAKNFICVVLHPSSARRPTTERPEQHSHIHGP